MLNFLPFIAVVEFLKRVHTKDYEGAAWIIIAGLAGVVVGYLHIAGFDVTSGFVAAESAVGVHTVGQAMAGK